MSAQTVQNQQQSQQNAAAPTNVPQQNQSQPFNILNTSFMNCAPEDLSSYLPFPTAINESDELTIVEPAFAHAGQEVVNSAVDQQLLNELVDLLNHVSLPPITFQDPPLDGSHDPLLLRQLRGRLAPISAISEEEEVFKNTSSTPWGAPSATTNGGPNVNLQQNISPQTAINNTNAVKEAGTQGAQTVRPFGPSGSAKGTKAPALAHPGKRIGGDIEKSDTEEEAVIMDIENKNILDDDPELDEILDKATMQLQEEMKEREKAAAAAATGSVNAGGRETTPSTRMSLSPTKSSVKSESVHESQDDSSIRESTPPVTIDSSKTFFQTKVSTKIEKQESASPYKVSVSKEEDSVAPAAKRRKLGSLLQSSRTHQQPVERADVTRRKFEDALFRLLANTPESINNIASLQTFLEEEDEENIDIPLDVLFARPLLNELLEEACKMKVIGMMKDADMKDLMKAMQTLSLNVVYGYRISAEELDAMRVDNLVERVERGLVSAMTVLCFLASPDMPKEVIQEDCIDACVRFLRYHFDNTLFPSYNDAATGKTKLLSNPSKPRGRGRHALNPQPKKMNIRLFNKFSEFVTLLGDLVCEQHLPDRILNQLWTTALKPFYTENISEIQMRCMQLVVNIFSRYSSHREPVFKELVSSLNRVTYIRRDLRLFRLSNDENIQQITALFLLLMQGIIVLDDKTLQDKSRTEKDLEKILLEKYDQAINCCRVLLDFLLSKVTTKSDDNLRQFFEHVISDVLTCMPHPEWPFAECFIVILKHLLLQRICSSQTDQSTKMYCIDFMAHIGGRMMSCERQLNEADDEISKAIEMFREQITAIRDSDRTLKKMESTSIWPDQLILHEILVEYFRASHTNDTIFNTQAVYAHLALWLHENSVGSNSKHYHHLQSCSSADQSDMDLLSDTAAAYAEDEEDEADQTSRQLSAKQEKKLSGKIYTMMMKNLIRDARGFASTSLTSALAAASHGASSCRLSIHDGDAIMAMRALLLRTSFFQRFDTYLHKLIVLSTKESANLVKARYMKCLNTIVEADEKLLGRKTIKKIVENRLYDPSISVRESAVDLVGKCIITQPELLDQYYDLLTLRLLDTGVSVRKRVIRIFKDVCSANPEHDQIVDMCIRLMRRFEDEDSVKKLIHEFFQQLWLIPVDDDDQASIERRIEQIVEVASTCRNTKIGSDTLLNFFKHLKKEDDLASANDHGTSLSPMVYALRQIVDALVGQVIRIDQEIVADGLQSCNEGLAKHALAMGILAECVPSLFVRHLRTILPYLSQRINGPFDNLVVEGMARVLARAVPVMDHPQGSFLAQLEEAVSAVFLRRGVNFHAIEAACLCLSEVSQKVTHNWKILGDLYKQFFKVVMRLKTKRETRLKAAEAAKSSSNSTAAIALAAQHGGETEQDALLLQRSLCTLGFMTKLFNVSHPNIKFSPDIIKKNILEMALFYYRHDTQLEVQRRALFCLGCTCLQFGNLVTSKGVRDLYQEILTCTSSASEKKELKHEVLNNLLMVLWHADERAKILEEKERKNKLSRSAQREEAAAAMNDNVILQKSDDEFGRVATSTVQVYLKLIIAAGMDKDLEIRGFVLKIIHCTIRQRLLHPQQILPYLIGVCADFDEGLRSSAEQLLQEVDRKYSGHLQTKALEGIRLAYEYLKALSSPTSIVRGHRKLEGQWSSVLAQCYTLLRTSRTQRRSIVISLINKIDVENIDLDYQLFIGDNLAQMPYALFDEPVYIIHYIDQTLPAIAHQAMDAWNKVFDINPMECEKAENDDDKMQTDVLDEDDPDVLFNRCTVDTDALYRLYRSVFPAYLLAKVREHLQQIYKVPLDKLQQYNPAENSKSVERPLTYRKANVPMKVDALVDLLQREKLGNTIAEDKNGKQLIIKEYLELKRIISEVDNTLGISNEGAQPEMAPIAPIIIRNPNAITNGPTSVASPSSVSNQSSTASQPPIPKLHIRFGGLGSGTKPKLKAPNHISTPVEADAVPNTAMQVEPPRPKPIVLKKGDKTFVLIAPKRPRGDS